jgi:isopenicillin-N epimerase
MLTSETLSNLSWMLDKGITYMNHGSFGARPKEVFEAQIALKKEFERSPIQFLDREGKERVQHARIIISQFLGCSEKNLGFIENATTGVGCVIQSLNLPVGSELVATNHVYNGVRQLLAAASERNDWTYREIEVQTPVHSPQQILDTVIDGFSDKTKLLVIDHVASITGVVFPVKELVLACKERGIAILVDGAHAPGMLDLNINQLSPDWYVGNLHKWVCGPPGAGFLWVNDAHLENIHPMTISHFYKQGFINEFDWQGTRDITSILCAAIAVQWGEKIGWKHIRNHNHSLAVSMQSKLIDAWKGESLSPSNGSMIGSMATVQLPIGFPLVEKTVDAMQKWLYDQYQIEVPIMLWQDRTVVRISAQLYTELDDINRLINAVEASKEHFCSIG